MQGFVGFLKNNWPYIVGFVVMAVLTYLLLFFLGKARTYAEEQLNELKTKNPNAYLERLENNKRLKIIFTKSKIAQYKLDGFMAIGNTEKVKEQIAVLDSLSLQPKEKVEFLQKRLSFFAEQGEGEEAKKSLDRLKNYLIKVKADKVEKYEEIINEAELIVGIYIDKDTSLIGKLIQKAATTKNDIMRGITQYRVAKLAYFKGDKEMVIKYLERAEKNLKGTFYEAIIQNAKKDNKVLETK